MSKNHSMKEAILGIYLKERPQVIESVLGFEVHYIALEQKYGSHSIDLKCADMCISQPNSEPFVN